MSEQIARTRVEIFSNPCLFDDNFVNDWTAEGGATFITDGDIVELKCGGSGDYDALYTFAAAKNTNPNRYLTAWATALTGTNWSVKVYSGATLKVSKTYTTTGIKEIDLYAEFGSHFSYDKVRLWVNGTLNQYARFDYITIGDAAMLVPTTTSDIIDDLTVTQPILSKGISGAKMHIFNPDGVYTGLVSETDVILIYLWRDGDAQKKIFGGRVVAPGSDASLTANEFYITIDAHDHGWELHKPASLVDTVYAATSGKTIIQNAVDLCAYLSKKFVDVDNDIASTHDVELNGVTPGNVINDISKIAETSGGVVGFDGYVDPAGNLNVFKREKYTSPVNPAVVLNYKYNVDTDRIVNKQKVYGAAESIYPAGGDLCESLTPTEGVWSAITGSSYVYLEDTEKLFGSHSIRGQLEANGPTLMMRFTFNSSYEPDCSYPPLRRYGEMVFYVKFNNVWNDAIWVVLCDDAGKRVTRYVRATYDNWAPVVIPMGVKTANKEWLPWPGDATFNWAKIVYVQVYIWTANVNNTGSVYIDGLHFGGRRYEGEYEDSASEATYWTRQAEPIVDDGLRSNAQCTLYAKGVVQYLKDAITTFEDFKVIGDNRYLPGYKQTLALTVDNIAADFKIIEVRHKIIETYWETTLMLDNEPQKIDYLFSALFDGLRRIGSGGARMSGLSTSGGGGGTGIGIGEIVNNNLAANSVSTNNLQANSVTTNILAANSVTANNIAANSVQAINIAAGVISANHIASCAIIANKIYSGIINANHISANAISADAIQAGVINANHLSANSVTADKILAGTIQTNKLAANCVTTNIIAGQAVSIDKVDANMGSGSVSVLYAKYSEYSRTATGDVTGAKLYTRTVGAETKMAYRIKQIALLLKGTRAFCDVYVNDNGAHNTPITGWYDQWAVNPHGGGAKQRMTNSGYNGLWGYRDGGTAYVSQGGGDYDILYWDITHALSPAANMSTYKQMKIALGSHAMNTTATVRCAISDGGYYEKTGVNFNQTFKTISINLTDFTLVGTLGSGWASINEIKFIFDTAYSGSDGIWNPAVWFTTTLNVYTYEVNDASNYAEYDSGALTVDIAVNTACVIDYWLGAGTGATSNTVYMEYPASDVRSRNYLEDLAA